MTVSIIIAVKIWQKHLEECVSKCQELDFVDFEIIILPDNPPKELSSPELIRIIPTGPLKPADKRDIAIKYAKGEILAFIDDDAYPAKDWLTCALENFKDEEIAAVGGPNLTPAGDSLLQQASGAIYASFLVSGNFVYRYAPRKKREVNDLPSCNFFVRKSIMQELGGFATKFWPGEDTKLCLDITKKLGKKIIYDPKVLVYHHRRPVYLAHLRQIADYALHRGYFVKKYPQTSLKISYFLPSIFVIAQFCGSVISLFSISTRAIYFSGLSLYLVLVFIFSLSKKLRLIPYVFFGIILTHINYGIYFLKGLSTKRLSEET